MPPFTRLPRAFLSGLLLLTLSLNPAQAQYATIIRHARVLEGSGNPWFYADVAFDGERITAIGALDDAMAAHDIDAAGLYLAPGFIDAHSHAAEGLTAPDRSPAEPLLAQGLTTVAINPDGGGPVDLVQQRDSLLRDGLGLNVMQLVPHGSIRRQVMGMDDRPATADELAAMQALVEAGMGAGGWGLSSGPFYVPGSFSDVIEKKVVDLPAAIHSMTSLPAQVFGLPDRGVIREGAIADLIVFDLNRLRDRATFTEPYQMAEGVVHVFVNGAAARLDGEATGVLAGRVLRKGR